MSVLTSGHLCIDTSSCTDLNIFTQILNIIKLDSEIPTDCPHKCAGTPHDGAYLVAQGHQTTKHPHTDFKLDPVEAADTRLLSVCQNLPVMVQGMSFYVLCGYTAMQKLKNFGAPDPGPAMDTNNFLSKGPKEPN